jgi:hypothetical protein
MFKKNWALSRKMTYPIIWGFNELIENNPDVYVYLFPSLLFRNSCYDISNMQPLSTVIAVRQICETAEAIVPPGDKRLGIFLQQKEGRQG